MLNLIQKVQIQNTLPSIGLVTNAAFNKKLQKLKTKYLILPVLLILPSLID